MKHIKVHVNLSKHQENKIKDAINNKTSVRLRLNNSNLHSASNSILILTENQYAKLQDGLSHYITIPYNRLEKIIHGGFLPFLLPILGALGAVAGLSGGIAGTVASAKKARAADAERQLAEERLKKERSGKGINHLVGVNCAGVSPRYVNECKRRLKELNIN